MPHGKPTITERPSFPSLLISRQSQRSTSSVASTSAEVTVAPSSVAGADTSGNAIFAPDVRDDYGNDHAEGRGQSPTPDLSERLRDQLKSTEQRRRAQSNTSRGSSQSRSQSSLTCLFETPSLILAFARCSSNPGPHQYCHPTG